MRFFVNFTLVFAAACVFTGTCAKPAIPKRATESAKDAGSQLALSNSYGAPIPPWKPGCKPGWYYGDQPSLSVVVELDLFWLKDSLLCLIIDLLPLCLHCPPPHPPPPPPNHGWKLVFSNLTGAIEGDDYLTFGLVDTVDDCQTMCQGVTDCVFFNTYHDVNGKNGSPLLTCALFSGCHTAADAINMGGQTQPDGSIDYITDSAGYCYE